jgi:hypothetical protein
MLLANSKRLSGRVKTAIAVGVVFTTLALTRGVPAWAAAQETPTAPEAFASAGGEIAASRKNKNDVGIRGHGFVASNGVFTTIGAPDAAVETAPSGLDSRGQRVGLIAT